MKEILKELQLGDKSTESDAVAAIRALIKKAEAPLDKSKPNKVAIERANSYFKSNSAEDTVIVSEDGNVFPVAKLPDAKEYALRRNMAYWTIEKGGK